LFLFRSLASGSSGNAYLLRTATVSLLFEIGVPLPRLARYLQVEGISPDSLDAVLVSHEHSDHCSGARDLACENGTQIWGESRALEAAGLGDLPVARVLHVGVPAWFGDVEVLCFPVPHDAVAPVGFLIRSGGRTITIATDAGEPTRSIAEAVSQADLVVLEANHDVEMLRNGRYPYRLRRRVSGRMGHLSNAQAGSILARSLRRDNTDVWLAHLSKENNSAALAVRTVHGYLKAAGLGGVSLEVAQRDRPSLRWDGNPRPRQLSLFDAENTFPTVEGRRVAERRERVSA
jgi:phosphoribosyl 1,2-cyclic phosphodiesterase